MSYKRYSAAVLVLCTLALMTVAAMNYSVDPANMFRDQYSKDMAEIILRGMNAANVTNYDERLLQQIIIEKDPSKRDIIVLGSSRTMEIGNSLFPGKTFFNHSVSGASLEDDIAIYFLYREHKRKPQTIIFGLDPWLLNKNSGQSRWIALAGYYFPAVETWGVSSNLNITDIIKKQYQKYKELISLPYLLASVKTWRQSSDAKSKVFATYERQGSTIMKLNDGTISYDDSYRKLSVEDVRKSAREYARAEPIYSLGEYDQLDPGYKKIFEAFIDQLQSDGVHVVFVLPAYHPVVYSTFRTDKRYSSVLEAENYFRAVAGQKGIRAIGSYDPVLQGLGESDFWDGMHPKPYAIGRVIIEGMR